MIYRFEHQTKIDCCIYCPMMDFRCDSETTEFCRATSKDIPNTNRKPKWCPLQEVE